MHFRVVAVLLLALAAFVLVVPAVSAESIPAIDLTMTIDNTGSIHVWALQTVPESLDGVTDYYFDLSRSYRPENVSVYHYETRKPIAFDVKESSTVNSYSAHFDKPYYHGYQFVVEYDCHNRIVYEGKGVYSLGMRPAIDVRVVDRTYTVILPPKNFTYLGYNTALDHPVSETETEGYTYIKFHNVSDAGSDYAWEVRFSATGIDREARSLDVSEYTMPIPGMSFIAAIAALLIFAIAVRKR